MGDFNCIQEFKGNQIGVLISFIIDYHGILRNKLNIITRIIFITSLTLEILELLENLSHFSLFSLNNFCDV